MIALIIVNYRKSELTVRLCQSLARVTGALSALRIIIVDNGSDEASLSHLQDLRTLGLNIEILAEKTNWGYFGGARRGLNAIQSWGEKPNWVVLSNSDIEFPNEDFVGKLSAISDAKIGVLAPRIQSGISLKDQNPYMLKRPGAARMHFLKWIFRFRVTCFVYQMAGLLKSLLKSKLEEQGPVANDPGEFAREIYAGHGSFMIFSKSYFDCGGDFDHKPFLFGEEVTVAENCRRLGLKVLYVPELVVAHADHGTMGWVPSPLMLRCQREASEFCADTYFPLRG